MPDFTSHDIDHLDIGVADARRARDFHAAALAPLGIDLTLSIPPEGAEPGGDQARSGGWPFGFAARAAPHKPMSRLLGGCVPGQGLHVAFGATTCAQVGAFHAAALAAGGTDNGPPGLGRYHGGYHGAVVRDPDGHDVEAVCHAPEQEDRPMTRATQGLPTGGLIAMATLPTAAATDDAGVIRVNPPGLFDPTPFGYSQAVIVPAGRRTAYVSGQGGADATGALSPDFGSQVEQAFANLRAALDGIGARPDQVVRLTIYVVDHDQSKLGVLTQAVVEMFGTALPAQTLVPVPRLALDGMLFEVEAVALPD